MAHKRVPTPSCPEGHARATIHARGIVQRKKGTTRRWWCSYEANGEPAGHYFSTLVKPAPSPREVLDKAVPMPRCEDPAHERWRLDTNGTYMTLAGPRQRYRCTSPDDPKVRHTFTAPLPRSVVEDDTCCDDCQVPTPRHAGAEAATRRLNYPPSVICDVLNDLAEGRSYTHTSMRALERVGRPTGRSRSVGGNTVTALNAAGSVSPDRELKAHWHISADILERFAPLVTEPAFDKIRAEEARYRAAGLPVVYVVDEVPVKRNFGKARHSPVVWNALVVSRMRWDKDRGGTLVGRSSRLVRVRAVPSVTKESWALVMSELDAPDFLIADGATAIEKAAMQVWGSATEFVPCVWHATRNIHKRLTPKGGQLPEKVRDHLFLLTRDLMAANGTQAVTDWFNELDHACAACDLPMETFEALRNQYAPLLARSAAIAVAHPNPKVPISNASVENQISTWVDRLTSRRGAMFANLARTNLLGDLIVAGANGALLDRHKVIGLLRDHSRANGGWAPPPRALVEPAGVSSLRDPGTVTELLRQVGL